MKSTKKCVSLVTMVRVGLVLNLMAVSLSVGSRSITSKRVETIFTVNDISLSAAQSHLNDVTPAFSSSTSILGRSLEARAANALILA